MDKNNFSNLKAKKSLGQNFLKSKKALKDMIGAGEVGENDIVLEAGPGKGALTEELLKKAGKVIAVEKDDMLVEFLRDKFKVEIESGKLELVHDDILNFNPTTYPPATPEQTHSCDGGRGHLPPTTFPSQSTTFKLIANIPYYITGQFLRKFLSGDTRPSKMVILLQKEVVKRIVANDGKESILSISIKAYGRPKNIGKVSKESFSPKPKVDSAILLIDNISRDFFDGIDEKRFFDIMKAGFAHKRKLLAGNLEHSKDSTWKEKNREEIEEIFKNCGIPPKARAEDLKIEQWKCLSSNI